MTLSHYLGNTMKPSINPIVSEKLWRILSPYDSLHYENTEIYLVDKNAVKAIKELQNELLASEESSKSKYKQGPLYPYMKLLNPDNPAFKYSFYMAHKPIEILDPMKVKDRMLKEVDVWINVERKRFEEKMNDTRYHYTQEEAQRYRADFEAKITTQSAKAKEIYDMFYDYEVIITNYENPLLYAGIYFLTNLHHGESELKPKHKKHLEHLRKEVVNVLWFYDYRKFDDLRSNNTVAEAIRTHTCICDTIYFQKKS